MLRRTRARLRATRWPTRWPVGGWEAGALPIVPTHGRPSTFLKLIDLARRLAEPSKHGGDASDAFTVVVPSLPRYAFSPPRPALTRRVERVEVPTAVAVFSADLTQPRVPGPDAPTTSPGTRRCLAAGTSPPTKSPDSPDCSPTDRAVAAEAEAEAEDGPGLLNGPRSKNQPDWEPAVIDSSLVRAARRGPKARPTRGDRPAERQAPPRRRRTRHPTRRVPTSHAWSADAATSDGLAWNFWGH